MTKFTTRLFCAHRFKSATFLRRAYVGRILRLLCDLGPMTGRPVDQPPLLNTKDASTVSS